MADTPADPGDPLAGRAAEILAAMAQTRADLAAKVNELQRRIIGGVRPRTMRGETPMAKAKAKKKAVKKGAAKAKAAPAAKRKTAAKAGAKKKGGAKKAAVKARRG